MKIIIWCVLVAVIILGITWMTDPNQNKRKD